MTWLGRLFGSRPSRGPTRQLDTGTMGTRELDDTVYARIQERHSETNFYTVRDIRREVFRCIAEGMDEGKRVQVRGFATFYASRVPAHIAKVFGSNVQVNTRDLPRCRFSRSIKKWMRMPGRQPTGR